MATPTSIQTRQSKLIEKIQQNQLHAMVVNPGPSLHYLTGLHFHLSERPVVMIFSLHQPPAIVLPKLEAAKLGAVNYPLQSFTYGEDPIKWVNSFTQALKASGLKNSKIGVESRSLPRAGIGSFETGRTWLRVYCR